MPKKISEIRREFEQWASKPPFEFDLTINGEESAWPGNYKDFNVDCAWDAWLDACIHYNGPVEDDR
jgi:hypothetical protein